MVSIVSAFNSASASLDAPASDRSIPLYPAIGSRDSRTLVSAAALAPHPTARLAVGTSLNGRAAWIPTEFAHSSRWAEACQAAQIVREASGFETRTSCAPITTAQIWLRDCPDPLQAERQIHAAAAELLQAGLGIEPSERLPIGCIPALNLFDHGNGTLEVVLYAERADEPCSRAMRAAARSMSPRLADLAGTRHAPEIQHGVLERERVRARCRLWLCCLSHGRGGTRRSASHRSGTRRVAASTARLEREFATDRHQPELAAMHNDHVLEGLAAAAAGSNVDPACFTLEARSYAARWGSCEPLARWRISGDALFGELCMPVDLAAIGDSLVSRVQHEVSFRTVRDVTEQVATIGLASSLAYLRWKLTAE